MFRLRVLVLAAAALALPACNSASLGANPADANPTEGRISPLPYGYQEPASRPAAARPEGGQELDEVVAVVWGEVLTRRRLVRETGGRQPGQDDAAFERELGLRRVEWAREQLLVKAAQQEGLRIVEAQLDEAMEREKARKVKELGENTGRPVTFEEYLAQQRISEQEFRAGVKNRELKRAYLAKLLVGLGKQARPQVDLSVSPAEVRRLYRERPEDFDVQPGVRFALFQLLTVEALTGDTTPAQAEERTRAKAEQVAQALRAGTPPAEVARRFELSDRAWTQSKGFEEDFRFAEGKPWLFDPSRRKGDARVFEFEKAAGGPVVLGVLETRPGAKMTFDEAYGKVVTVYELVRQNRLENEKVIELVQAGGAWPESLADSLVEDARRRLARLDKDPVYSRARFR